MNTGKTSKNVAYTGLFTAIAASLCCITPILALIAGTSGIASTFSWIEPFRPYLIAITVIVLAFAWYQKLKPRTQEEIDCACEEDEKPSFLQSKLFLGIVTAFAMIMLAFPYYSQIFYPQVDQQVIIVSSDNVEEINFNIEGMTCTGCEQHVKHAVNKLPGILEVTANYEERSANVRYDKSKTNKQAIIDVIDATGYKVINLNE
ncbi:MAG: mercuric transport protein MerTP [Bacteroidetes bacterium]|nr:mercuric transport protein MerTP [Bacteroidota bacterium]